MVSNTWRTFAEDCLKLIKRIGELMQNVTTSKRFDRSQFGRNILFVTRAKQRIMKTLPVILSPHTIEFIVFLQMLYSFFVWFYVCKICFFVSSGCYAFEGGIALFWLTVDVLRKLNLINRRELPTPHFSSIFSTNLIGLAITHRRSFSTHYKQNVVPNLS